MEAVKDGRKKLYTDEQVPILDSLDAHIKETKAMEGFPSESAEPQIRLLKLLVTIQKLTLVTD